MKLEQFKMDMLLMGWSYTYFNTNLVEPNKKTVTSHVWVKNGSKIVKSYLTQSIEYHPNNSIVSTTFCSFDSMLHYLMVEEND